MASIKERMNIFEKRIQSNKVNQNNNNPFQKKLNPSDKIKKSNTNTSNKKENNDDFVLKKSQTIAEKNPLVQKLSLNKKEDNQINKKTQDEKYKIEDNKIVNKKEEISKNQIKDDNKNTESKEGKLNNEKKDIKENKEKKEKKEINDNKDTNERKEKKEKKELKDIKDNKEKQENKEREKKENKEEKDKKEVKEKQDKKNNKEENEIKNKEKKAEKEKKEKEKEKEESKENNEKKENKEKEINEENKEKEINKNNKEEKEEREKKESLENKRETKANEENKLNKENNEIKNNKDIKEKEDDKINKNIEKKNSLKCKEDKNQKDIKKDNKEIHKKENKNDINVKENKKEDKNEIEIQTKESVKIEKEKEKYVEKSQENKEVKHNNSENLNKEGNIEKDYSKQKEEVHKNKEKKQETQKNLDKYKEKENGVSSDSNKDIKKDITPNKNIEIKHCLTIKESNERNNSSSELKPTFSEKLSLNDELLDDFSDSLYNVQIRKYNFKNIGGGKKFFKNRYVNEKVEEIDTTIKRMTLSGNVINLNGRESFKCSTSSLPSASNNNYQRESESRKCQTEFLLIVEKAIISFNIKKYQESYTYLESSGVIKNVKEFGEFLLVVSGFDKFIIGEFLAKEKQPNENKEVLISFINAIDMDYTKYRFLDCLRFLLTRLILPKDANLILVLMDTFSQHFYESNEKNENFKKIFKNTNAIYLLVSTILALNTMFTRKDIKNMNVIKKDEFKSMNKDIDSSYINDLYDELKKKPISLSDDYNEEIYKKLSTLVLVNTKDINSKDLDSLRKGISSENSENKDNNCKNNESKKDIKKENKDEKEENKDNYMKKTSTEKLMEQKYYEFIQDFMDLDIVRKTLRGNYYRKKSFSMNTNLLVFNEEDKKLLSKPNKFYHIQGSSKPVLKEFIIYDNFKKLTFDKTIDVSKQKYKKFIEICDINDVYVGINHGDNIKKYIKAYPQEEKLANNFISIVYNNHKEQLDIKHDDISIALLWFKAMKSLVIQIKTKEEKEKFSNVMNKLNEIHDTISLIWEENILTHWDSYGKYLILKSYEKYNYFRNIMIQPEKQAKLDLLDEKRIMNAKTIEDFLKEINDRFNKNSNIRLEYYEFYCLCYLGFPSKLRKKLWSICIGNNFGLNNNFYIHSKEDIIKEKYDFCELDFKYRENSNIQFNPEYKKNQIIIDIIKSRYIFLQEINEQQLDEDELMQKVYNITVIFNTIRSDIPYNKGIVSIIYFFLLVGLDEVNCFICITNLICSRSTLKFFMVDKDEIHQNVEFFNKLLETYSKEVFAHLNKLEINPELYLIPWLEKLFTQSLDYNILLHVFDLYLLNGEYILFQTAITIIKLLEKDLLDLTISEIFKMLKILPKKYTELDFFEKFKAYNCIKDDYITWNKNNFLTLQQKEIDKIEVKK